MKGPSARATSERALSTREDELRQKHRHHERETEERHVLPVPRDPTPGEAAATLVPGPLSGRARYEKGYSGGVSLVGVRVSSSEARGLSLHHRVIDEGEEREEHRDEDPPSRRDYESEPHEKAPYIKRIPRPRIRPAHRQNLVLLEVPGSPETKGLSESRDDGARSEKNP
jgi:hypothetical protein